MKAIFKNLIILSALFCQCNNASAEIVKGQAYIENGNISKASADARKDAMRSFVESKIGVKVSSTTEVVNNMLVRDSILAKSDGYVLVKKVISEKPIGDTYQVILDLEANNSIIQTAIIDIPGRLKAIEDDASRNGIHVAIVDDDVNSTAIWNGYFSGVLKEVGFRAEVNDDVVMFLANNINRMNDLQLNSEVRRIGRLGDRGAANSIIRGRVSLARGAEKMTSGSYKAVAQVNCELISYDNNTVDVASGYYSYIADNPFDAERLAKEIALKTAAQKLGTQALETNQQEYRGGVHNIKATLVFNGINNKAQQRKQIINALTGMNCRVIRSNFLANGSFQVFCQVTEFNNIEELKESVLSNLSGDFPNIIDAVDDGKYGSSKIGFDLWG